MNLKIILILTKFNCIFAFDFVGLKTGYNLHHGYRYTHLSHNHNNLFMEICVYVVFNLVDVYMYIMFNCVFVILSLLFLYPFILTILCPLIVLRKPILYKLVTLIIGYNFPDFFFLHLPNNPLLLFLL